MMKFRSLLLPAALLAWSSAPALAMTVQYAFQAPVSFESRNNLAATDDQRFFNDGDLISGVFTYDSGVTDGIVLPGGGTFYPFPAMSNLSGSILGNEFSDPGGAVGVFNDAFDSDPSDPNSALVDFLILVAATQNSPANLSGFEVINGPTTFELFNVRLFWIEETTDFFDDETLPGSLPPAAAATARIALDFRDVTDPNNIHRVFAEPLSVSAIPLPAAVWLFGSALLGVAGLKRKKAN